jgi:enoyl-CoA hydratase/carnithine racemase
VAQCPRTSVPCPRRSRGRALEILLVADDLDGPRAELYGYVNRLIAEDHLDGEVDQIASRLARLDHDAIARAK